MKKTNRNEKGIALLFALGILSALMVLGFAFINSSLFYQNIAGNRRAAGEAKIIARSVAHRIAAAAMHYQHQLDKLSADQMAEDRMPADYSMIFSVSDPNGISDEQDEKGEFIRGYDHDGKNTTPLKSILDVAERTSYLGDNSYAQWVYLRKPAAKDSEEEDRAGEIYARFAYQVLPPSSPSRMVYFNVLGGGVNSEYFRKRKYPGDTDHSDDNFGKGGWEIRWGQNIDELNLNQTTVFSGWQNDNEIKDIAANYADFYATSAADYLHTKDDSEDTAKRKAWFEYWFAEGENPILKEAGPGNSRRFNLGAYKDDHPWYKRFDISESDHNSDTVVEKIAAFPDVLIEHDYKSNDDRVDLRYDDQIEAEDRGLPFFKRIADDKGSFADLAARRKQIVANFNDYCDKDSVPTSDVKAAEWSPDNVPAYTGNEKTMYLNELAWAFQINSQVKDSLDIEYTVKPVMIAETVKMYDQLALADTYSLVGRVQDVEAEVKLDIAIEVKCTPADAGVAPRNFTVDITTDPVTVTLDKGDITIDAIGTEEYSAGVGAVSKEGSKSVCYSTDEIKDKIRNTGDVKTFMDANNGTLELEKITEIKSVTVSNISFQPGNVVLKSGDKPVDYVKVSNLTISGDPGNMTLKRNGEIVSVDVFAGGAEVNDPRQNLNLNGSGISDWVTYTTIGSVPGGTLGVTALGGGADLVSRIGTVPGEANNNSDPGASGTGTPGVDYDRESVTGVTAGISTAVIRNAPMVSPWELGWIHRGAAWETINLKCAGGWDETRINWDQQVEVVNSWNEPGTSYKNGDGGILDWVKFTQDSRSFGKIDLNCFSSDELERSEDMVYGSESHLNIREWQKEIAAALFYDIRLGEKPAKFITESKHDSAADPTTGSKITASDAKNYGNSLVNELESGVSGNADNRFMLRSEVLNLGSDRDFWVNLGGGKSDDAAEEELIGKTINLLTAESSPANIFRAVIVVQTITDVGGEKIGDEVEVQASEDPFADEKDALLGKFDMTKKTNPENNLHYDVITGEVKMLVTYERDPVSGRIRIRHMENIE